MAAHAHAEQLDHHGPPAPHFSSRVTPAVLGMFLFIASEIMLFGSFFTAYFFVRVVNGEPWPLPPFHLPIFVAGINTAILVTHQLEEAIDMGGRILVFGRPGRLLADIDLRSWPADKVPGLRADIQRMIQENQPGPEFTTLIKRESPA